MDCDSVYDRMTACEEFKFHINMGTFCVFMGMLDTGMMVCYKCKVLVRYRKRVVLIFFTSNLLRFVCIDSVMTLLD